MLLLRLTAALGLAAVAAAAPLPRISEPTNLARDVAKPPSTSCAKLVEGLSRADCEYMASIQIKGQGVNARKDPGSGIWVGDDGPNLFRFKNKSKGRVTIVIWNKPDGDYESSFLKVRQPQVTWSLDKGQGVTVSLAKRQLSGGFAAIYERSTNFTEFGQLGQTWGEFTTGDFATINVSRLVRMDGEPMKIRTGGGCVTSMTKCVFLCKTGNTCGKENEYVLRNCVNPNEQNPKAREGVAKPTIQVGAVYGERNQQPEGGCQAWSKQPGGKGEVTITLLSK